MTGSSAIGSYHKAILAFLHIEETFFGKFATYGPHKTKQVFLSTTVLGKKQVDQKVNK